MPEFAVTDHRISRRQWNTATLPLDSHMLELFGPEDFEGCRDSATLIFDEALDMDRLGPVVGYATRTEQGPISVVGWLPAESFDAWRELVLSRGVEKIQFEMREPGAGTGYLRRLGLVHPSGRRAVSWAGLRGAVLRASRSRDPAHPL